MDIRIPGTGDQKLIFLIDSVHTTKYLFRRSVREKNGLASEQNGTNAVKSIQVPKVVHFFHEMEQLCSFLVLISIIPIEHFFFSISDFSLQPIHLTSNGPVFSQSECDI